MINILLIKTLRDELFRLGKLIFGLPKFYLKLIAVGDRENLVNFPG